MSNISKLENQVQMVQEESTEAKIRADKAIKNINNNTTKRFPVALEDDETPDEEEEDNPPEQYKKKVHRGIRGSKRNKKLKSSCSADDIAERAAFVLEKSLDEQAMMYELFEAKKKEQAQKIKVNKYFMKYGKNF